MVWGDTLNFSTTKFTKGPRILNMVMTFVLTPWSHYNTIIEPCACFLLSLLEDLSIDFPSYMIVSMIDIETLLHVISSSSLRLSHVSSHTFTFPFLSLLFSPSWVPSALVLSGRVTLNFNRSGHEWRWSILQLLLFHPLPRLLLTPWLVVWPLRPSWSSFSRCRLTLVVVLTISLMRHVRWTPE